LDIRASSEPAAIPRESHRPVKRRPVFGLPRARDPPWSGALDATDPGLEDVLASPSRSSTATWQIMAPRIQEIGRSEPAAPRESSPGCREPTRGGREVPVRVPAATGGPSTHPVDAALRRPMIRAWPCLGLGHEQELEMSSGQAVPGSRSRAAHGGLSRSSRGAPSDRRSPPSHPGNIIERMFVNGARWR